VAKKKKEEVSEVVKKVVAVAFDVAAAVLDKEVE